VAHAYTKDQTYVLIHAAITGTDNTPAKHPDQQYWKMPRVQQVLSPIANDVVHIEIDCTLLPCAHDKSSCCLVEVPKLIKGLLGGRDVPLVIYSHRKEIADIGATPEEGARFVCNTGDDKNTLNEKQKGLSEPPEEESADLPRPRPCLPIRARLGPRLRPRLGLHLRPGDRDRSELQRRRRVGRRLACLQVAEVFEHAPMPPGTSSGRFNRIRLRSTYGLGSSEPAGAQ
jgi:hypothetical protein